MSIATVFEQPDSRVRLAWGRSGAAAAAARGDALVIVDVLSFSTAVVAAVSSGARIRPCAWKDDPAALAAECGAELAVRRQSVPEEGRFSLSPDSMLEAEAGEVIVLRSPNGATCAQWGAQVPALWVAGIVNAAATASVVTDWLAARGESVTVVACGERWADEREDGPLRVATEDYLGAGAVIHEIHSSLSAEAVVAAKAFEGAEHDLQRLVRECGSGLELCALGFPQDPEHAALLDEYDIAVRWEDGLLVPQRPFP